jgi:predicted MFS family arabinose efflux permease
MSITMTFGDDSNRPAYIGLANTLIAPAAITAPLLGGWLADQSGFSSTFGLSAIFGLATAAIFLFALKEPRTLLAEKQSTLG